MRRLTFAACHIGLWVGMAACGGPAEPATGSAPPLGSTPSPTGPLSEAVPPPALAADRNPAAVGAEPAPAAIALGAGPGGEPALPTTAAPAGGPSLLFTAFVPVGGDGDARLYVVLDETRGARGAATGAATEVGNDGMMSASTRDVDVAQLDAVHRELAAARVHTLGATCTGTLGPVVELTLYGIDDDGVPTLLSTSLAAPLEPACASLSAQGAYADGRPPARVYLVVGDGIDLEPATRAAVLAAFRALPAYRAIQDEYATELENESSAPLDPPAGPWDEDLGEATFRVLRDAAGHELVGVAAGSPETHLSALFEHVDAAYVPRGDDEGLVLDLEGDGSIERVVRTGLVRDGQHVRRFVSGPAIVGC